MIKQMCVIGITPYVHVFSVHSVYLLSFEADDSIPDATVCVIALRSGN